MARYSADHVPSYRLHKKSGQAVVTIAGADRYLGRHNTPESRDAYNQLIAQWFAGGRSNAALDTRRVTEDRGGILSVEQVVAAFWSHAKGYYRDSDGKPTEELINFKNSLRTLCKLFGKSAAGEFGPRRLKDCQADMIRQGLARNTINRRVGRIRQVFKWAVAEELIPSRIFEGLRTVEGLKRGRSAAKETKAVKPVAEDHARTVIKHANRQIAAMIELQLITGMRSGELVIMRTCDIDRSGTVWVYTPTKHKTQHHGHSRAVYLGKRAQEILMPFLKLNSILYLFSPAEAEADRRASRAALRKTPLSSGNRAGTNCQARPKRVPGERYEVRSYNHAVAKTCDKAFPLPAEAVAGAVKSWQKTHRFHPHQLRHAAATRFRRDHNLETARALLGQKSMAAAEIYAEMDMVKARDVMAVSG